VATRPRADARGSLAVVGTGIQLVRQLTPEAREEIERADEVLFVVADAATAAWLASLNPAARSLSGLYRPGVRRDRVYAAMVDEILGAVRTGSRVCAVFYGHPGVYVQPSHEAVRRARAEGFAARMLPAVSAEDCLVADLGVDPGEHGWQSYEATDFLARRLRPEPTAALVLWQVDGIGRHDASRDPDPRGLHALGRALLAHYPPAHELVFYRGADARRAAAHDVAAEDVSRARARAAETSFPLRA
jgi:precorrin-6B methylase 1